MLRTAVDTSILLDVFGADKKYGETSLKALIHCLEQGTLVACEVVWAEIRPKFQSRNELLGVADGLSLVYEPLTQDSALKAGEVMKEYRERGGKRDKMIPDFLIAAHALIQTDRLITRDRGFYRRYFSSLKIIEPGN
ncbi:MAG: type II toxin-antitoxin system VapC family toxin [Deltaproteobacteria bacterium]|nr:type II toxin-antitoxin system VapC family toxin [Deltaproteobacteria bacterium]